MIYLPDTNACITLLRRKNPRLIGRWHATRISEIVLSSVVIYELRYGADRASNPTAEHAKLDLFLSPFASIAFDAACARQCAQIRTSLERAGTPIGPYDLLIASTALEHGLILITHNVREFSRIPSLRFEDWEI